MKGSALTPEQLDMAILRSTLGSASHGIFTTDTELRVTNWNSWLEKHSGLSGKEVIGRSLFEVIPTLSERHLHRYFQDALKGESKIVSRALHGYLLPVPPELPGTDFTYMQQSARIAPLMLDDRIRGTITTVEDVTEREWQNTILRRDRERDELLSASLAHLLGTRDTSKLMPGIFSQISDHLRLDLYFEYRLSSDGQRLVLQSASGLTPEQQTDFEVMSPGEGLCGECARTLKPRFLTDLRTSDQPGRASLKSMGLNCVAAYPMAVGERRLGCLIFGSRERSSFSPEEKLFLQSICQYAALTADRLSQENKLEASEAQFRVMAETVPDIIFTATARGGFDFVNKHFCEYTGLTQQAASIFGWMKAIHPDDLKAVQDQWRETIQKGQLWRIEFRLRHKDGGFRWFVARARPIRNEANVVVKWFGAATDIDEVKQIQFALDEARSQLREHADILENQVEERTAKLRETIIQLESFSYTVAHDLRAPIRAIEGYAQALLEDYAPALDPEAASLLKKISRAGQRLDALTRDVLNYATISSEQIELKRVDVDEILKDVLVMNPALQPPRASISVVRPLHKMVAHPTLLSQTISNLLDNAVKFVAPHVTPNVEIRSELRSASKQAAINGASGHRVRLWIEDNGIGMDQESRTRVFGIFERAKGSGEYVGTGIGLAIVAKAVERMNGDYGVESSLGKGSRFWIELPSAE